MTNDLILLLANYISLPYMIYIIIAFVLFVCCILFILLCGLFWGNLCGRPANYYMPFGIKVMAETAETINKIVLIGLVVLCVLFASIPFFSTYSDTNESIYPFENSQLTNYKDGIYIVGTGSNGDIVNTNMHCEKDNAGNMKIVYGGIDGAELREENIDNGYKVKRTITYLKGTPFEMISEPMLISVVVPVGSLQNTEEHSDSYLMGVLIVFVFLGLLIMLMVMAFLEATGWSPLD